jgi:hypothetical protein
MTCRLPSHVLDTPMKEKEGKQNREVSGKEQNIRAHSSSHWGLLTELTNFWCASTAQHEPWLPYAPQTCYARICFPIIQDAVFVFHVSPLVLTLESAVAGSLNPLLLPLFLEMSSLVLPEPTLTVRGSADSKSADPGGSSGSGRLVLTRSILSFLHSCLSAMIDCIAGSATGQEERRIPGGLELGFMI